MRVIFYMTLMSLTVAACGNAGGEYIGKWVNLKDECSTLEIEQNGANFIVKVTEKDRIMGTGLVSTLSRPASVKDGMLRVTANIGMEVSAAVNQKTGTLLLSNSEYRRPTDKDKVCIAAKMPN